MLFRFFCLAFLDDVDERGGDDTGWDGDHRDADETDDAAEYFAERRNGVDVAVASGGEGNDRPPKAVTDVGEYLGLGSVLDEVHEDGGEADYDKAGCVGCDELVFDCFEGVTYDAEGFGVADELEDDEDVGEDDQVGELCVPIVVGEYAWEYGHEVDEAVEGEDVVHPCFERTTLWSCCWCGYDSGDVFDEEYKWGYVCEAE